MKEVLERLRRVVLKRERAAWSDGQLLESFLQRHDASALEPLVVRHGAMVWGVCRRILGNAEDAEDAFQATFLVLVRRADSIVPRQMVANWLYGVAHQTALKARATRAKRQLRERQVTTVPDRFPPLAEHPGNDMQDLLDRELSRLPNHYRAVIVLCDLEGRTCKDTADYLGVPQGTVASRLARAKAMLAKHLARHCPELSATALAFMLSREASAAMPDELVSATIKAATAFAAGDATAGLVSTPVATLTEGVLKAMLMTRLKTGLAVLLLVSGAAIGGGLIMAAAQTQKPAAEEKASPTPEGVPPTFEPKLRTSLEGHAYRATSVAFSPDGKFIASTSEDKTLKLWDIATGKPHITIETPDNPLSSVAFSPNGKMLASGGNDKTVKLWDIATGKEVFSLQGHGNSIGALAFSPDGKTLASGSRDQTVKLWDVATGKEVASFHGHTSFISSVAFSRDGKTLASASHDNTVRLWETATGKLRGFPMRHFGQVTSVAFSPDGKTIASAGYDKTVKVWDVATGKEQASLQAGTTPVLAVAFSPDGKMLGSAGWDRTVKLWDVLAGKERASLKGHSDIVQFLTFSPDGKTLASAGWDRSVKLWTISADPAEKQEKPLCAADLDHLWTTLSSDDAARAYRAINTLVRFPKQAVPLMKERLRRDPEPTAEERQRFNALIANLDNDQFSVRQKAREELEKLGKRARSPLRKKLDEKVSLEVQKQIEQLLARIEGFGQESLRDLRAIEVLEQIGTVEARQVLETLAQASDGLRVNREAKASLERLQRKAASP